MADDYNDAIATITRTLQERANVYSDAQHDDVRALGQELARGAQGHPLVAQELGFVAGLMALEPDAFYEAATLVTIRLLQDVRLLRATMQRLFHGADGILRWSPSSLGIRQLINAERMRTLLESIRQARFARSEITEEVHTDLIRKGNLAQRELAEHRQQLNSRAARIAGAATLDALRDDILAVERGIDRLLTLQGQWQLVGWRDFSLRRVLEHLDADITRDILGIENLPANEAPLDAAIVHTSLGLELLERLQLVTTPFGDLLSPDVRLTPTPNAKTRGVRLRPIPEVIKGRRTFSGKVSTTGALETCVLGPAEWDHPTWFEQGIQLRQTAQSGGWVSLGAISPVNEVLISSDSATLSRTADGSALEDASFQTQHAVVDYLTATNHSFDYAAGLYPGYNLLISDAAVVPNLGEYFRLGDEGGPRLRVDARAAASTTFAGVAGTYRELLVTDTEGDLAPFSEATYLQNLATALSPPLAFMKVTTTVGVWFGDFPLDDLDLPAGLSLVTAFEVDEPAASYYAGAFGGVQEEDTASPTGTVGSFAVEWPTLSPYVDEGWSAAALIYADYTSLDLSRTFIIGGDLTPDALTLLGNSLLGAPLRLWDPTGAEGPLEVTVQKVGIAEAPPVAGTGCPVEGDLVLTFTELIDVTVAWVLQLRASAGATAGYSSGFEIIPISPWRGWSDLALDIAPGDLIFTEDGQRCVVWTTSGSRVRVLPPISIDGMGVALNAFRTRYINRGDRLVQLSDDEAELGVWKVTGATYDGLTVRALEGVGVDLAVDTVFPALAVTHDTATTHRFEVIELDPDPTLVDVEGLDRKFALQLAKEVTLEPGSITPLQWYLRIAGRTEKAAMLGRSQVVLRSMSRPLPSTPIPAEFAVRVKSDGYDGTLDLIETWESVDGTPLGETPAGGSRVYDLFRRAATTVEALSLPEVPGTAAVRTLTQLRGPIQGPLATGGTASWPPWALMIYRLDRRTLPDLAELFRDIGRAKATVGLPRQAVSGQAGLTLVLDSTRAAGTLTLASAVIESRVEGCDVVFSSGDEPDPPIRVSTATIEDVTPLEVTFTLSRSVPIDLSGTVTLYESALSQAWREVRTYDRYAALLETWLQYPTQRPRNRIVETASRLRSNGFNKAAQALLDCEFAGWVDPSWATRDARDLVDKIEGVMASLSRQRGGIVGGGDG